MTVVITGGTGGLGFQAARHLARTRTVVLTGRDRRRTEDAAGRIADGRAVPADLDLSSLESVRRFARELPGLGLPPLEGIVCNAAVQVVRGVTRTADGHETTFAVNHLAHFLLANLLLPELEPGGRVVFVSSGTHDPAQRTGMPDPRLESARAMAGAPDGDGSPAEGRRRYTTSKLCNVLTAYEMARSTAAEGRDVRVNAYDPGLMPGTGLARDYSRLQQLAWNYLLPAAALIPLLPVRTARRSGADLAELAAGPRFADVTGAYFMGSRQTQSSAESYDADRAARLWKESAELVGL